MRNPQINWRFIGLVAICAPWLVVLTAIWWLFR